MSYLLLYYYGMCYSNNKTNIYFNANHKPGIVLSAFHGETPFIFYLFIFIYYLKTNSIIINR